MITLENRSRAQIKAMMQLRGRLTLRQFSQERGRLAVAILVVALLLPVSFGLAYATVVGYAHLPDHWANALLGFVLFALWMLWLTLPVFVSPINEAFDISRLMIYPLRRRDLITAVFLGTLFDYPTYIMLPLFAAIIWSFGSTSTIFILLIALLLSYGHLVMIGQLVGTAIGGLLQSRRVRDATIILMSVIGGSCYFINLATQRVFAHIGNAISTDQMDALLAWNPLDFLQWLPPGAAARAIERASVGAWAASLLWLLYSAAWLMLIIWLWYKLLLRMTTGEGYFFKGAKQEGVEKTAVSPTLATPQQKRDYFAWLPDDIAVIAHKEIATIWRLPQRRAAIVQGLLFPIFMGGFFLLGNEQPNYPAWVGLGIPLYALFAFWAAAQNMLSWEGRGLPTILLTPIPRQRIFIGKGIVLAVVAGFPFLLFGSGLIWLTQHWLTVVGVLTGLAVGVAAVGITAVFSVLFPIPINLESKRKRGSYQSGGSFKTGCATMTLVPLTLALVAIPPLIPLLVAYWFELLWVAIIGLLFSVAYAFFMFQFGCHQAGRLLQQREPELILAMKLPEDE